VEEKKVVVNNNVRP